MAGFSLPTVGQPNSTEDAKVLTILTGVNDVAAQYRTLLTQPMIFATTATGTYYAISSTSAATATGTATPSAPPLPYEILAADHAVTGLSTKLRVKLAVTVGSTSPSTVTLTAGLYPLTISAGNVTMGTVTSGSTAASSGLAINTISRFNSGDFTIPADGAYLLGLVVGSTTVPTGISIAMQLQVRNV